MTGLEPIGEILPNARKRREPAGDPYGEPLSERDELVLELVQKGVGLRKAESLVSAFPHTSIRQQLEWLPLRAARRPASLLIAAIEHGYDDPVYAEKR